MFEFHVSIVDTKYARGFSVDFLLELDENSFLNVDSFAAKDEISSNECGMIGNLITWFSTEEIRSYYLWLGLTWTSEFIANNNNMKLLITAVDSLPWNREN